MAITVPPKLYKYQPYNDKTLDNLKYRRIWFSKPVTFNDPFDCSINFGKLDETQWDNLYYEMKQYEMDGLDQSFINTYLRGDKPTNELKEGFSNAVLAILKEEREAEIQQLGIACFSEKVDDILMWSHYADCHKGFCLEFDTKFEIFTKALPVNYSETLPILDPLDRTFHPLMVLATTKAIGWAYEKEWRVFHEESDKGIRINPKTITGIYLGCAMPKADKDVITSILSGSQVALYEMKIAEKEFKVYPCRTDFNKE